MNIRDATPEDCAALARVQVDSYRTAYAGIFPQEYLDGFTYEEQEQDWRDLLASGMSDILLVAEADDGEIAGYALGRPGPTGIANYDCELMAVHVRRAFQRQGAGSRLAAAMARALQARGCESLMLWVLADNSARRFYERLGGRLLEETQISLGAVEVPYGWDDMESLSARGGTLRGER